MRLRAASAPRIQVWPPAEAYASRSACHLTGDQVRSFDANGYVVLRNWIGDELLVRLQAASAAWIADGWSLTPDDPNSDDFVFADRPGGRVMFRVSYLHDKRQPASLELLGSPQVLGVAEHNVCDVTDRYGWNVPSAIELEMRPGDVLLHDVMLLHGSEPVAGKSLRRTIYYEFRAAEEILAEGPWDHTWIDRRLRLVPLGLARYAAAFPDAGEFLWSVDPGFRPAPGASEAQELRIAHVVHMTGSYCSAGDAGSPHT